MKTTALVLITTKSSKTTAAYKQLRDDPIIKEVYPVTGPYDLIAILIPSSVDDVGKLITQHIHSIDGVERTITCISLSLG